MHSILVGAKNEIIIQMLARDSTGQMCVCVCVCGKGFTLAMFFVDFPLHNYAIFERVSLRLALAKQPEQTLNIFHTKFVTKNAFNDLRNKKPARARERERERVREHYG